MVKTKFYNRALPGKADMRRVLMIVVVGVTLSSIAFGVGAGRRAIQAEQRIVNAEKSINLLKDELEDEKGWTKIFQSNVRESNRVIEELEEKLKLRERTMIALARDNRKLKAEVAGYVDANWPIFMAIALGWGEGEPELASWDPPGTRKDIGWITNSARILPKGMGWKQIHDHLRPCENGQNDCSHIGEARLKQYPLPIIVSVPKTNDHCTICHRR